MKIIDIAILIPVLGLIVIAVRYILINRSKKSKGCKGCGMNCSSCKYANR